MGARLKARLASVATQLGFSFGCLAIRILPHRWLFALSDRLSALAFCLFRRFRLRSTRNIARVYRDELSASAIENLARRSLRNFFRDCLEIGIALESSDEEVQTDIPVTGKEYLDAALQRGSGVIILSAHLGNFFLLGTRLAIAGYPVFVLVNQPKDGQFAEVMDRYRLKAKQRTIHARPRREALKKLNEVLRRNEIAIIIADEYRRGNGIPVPLFGGTAIARRGPATLALRTGAAVVPACVVRQADDSLKLVIEPEIEFDRSGKGKGKVIENTIRLTRWLEHTVRRFPDQWNWMNVRWWENSTAAPIQPQLSTGSVDTKGDSCEKHQEGT